MYFFYFCIISFGHACLFQCVQLHFHRSHPPPLSFSCRIVELFPAVPINPHWGIVSKCLAYSKAACDPFVYSLLRHQYKKTCTDIINRLLKRSSLNTSGRGHENQGNSIPTVEWQSVHWWDMVWGLTWQLSGKTWSWFIVDEEEEDKYWLFLSTSAQIGSDIAKKRKKTEESWQTRANLCTGIPLCLHTEFSEQQISAANLLWGH